ncbi:type II toxin-antitoxin system RelE/ParE family toxin [Flavobacterium sp. Fl-318]|uniref:Type II toxin-antitoxin system RelE/ParE family toxin n=1 Tax=Flavobacterium cupriresistens TaxID=2893885 RepID=A0ABU4RFN2_9FLAO|nr:MULTISPECIES: type II toxin-antitoxin system RelE/ParE family toxin [unclassified Flavobacterium]MDX6190215.1 type II toxin-antitoxin system RelE/ParE family toxin [Flavobacterium sp. Fl-318]UFH43033.1 type II toxin-antitoxin system RelE/ParE family toxin [Flavobacterium sp. F-323]
MDVIWAPQAKKDFWNNIDYLEAEWSEKSALHFIKKVDTTIALLKNDTVLFLKTNYKNVYKIVITKHISLYYRIENETIQFTTFLEQLSRFRKIQIMTLTFQAPNNQN